MKPSPPSGDSDPPCASGRRFYGDGGKAREARAARRRGADAARRRQDPDAFEVLYDRHGGAAYSLAYRIVGDRAAAEEVTQEAFISIWRSGTRFDAARGSVRSWLQAAGRAGEGDRARLLRRLQPLGDRRHPRSADGTLRLAGVEQLPPGRVLEAWVSRDGEVEAVPVLFVPDRHGQAETRIADMGGVDEVMVTEEPRGGSVAPTGEPIVAISVPQ
ncbi:MAG TPA: sigma factor [Solirubrobacterales bacterium]|nr:sigma factor [Solirubrobacterales bacterium]